MRRIYCPFCEDMVELETEAHMLLVCPIYNEGRSRIFGIIDANYHEFSSYNDEEKLVFIMKNIDPSVARFIFDSFELRAFLLSKPKRNY